MELRQGLVQVPVALDRTNGGELFSMGEFASMAIYAIKMPELEVNDNLLHYSKVGLNYAVRISSS